jgi:glycosyltransferase involved in cell wall biosynthesis
VWGHFANSMSRTRFEQDTYPGRPRILFVGHGESSHTHAWVDLLEKSNFNVRLFSLPSGYPPDSWWPKTYVTTYGYPSRDSETRLGMFNRGHARRLVEQGAARVRGASWNTEEKTLGWLSDIVRRWQPHIVHTLGLEPAAYFYSRARKLSELEGIGKWVAQVRGGPDLALHRLLPEYEPRIREVLAGCDKLVADNQRNYEYALALGLKESQLSTLGAVPGTGGIDVERLSGTWQGNPSQRRIILWPKAYECPQSKALPVLEALRLVWERLPPCEIQMLAVWPEVKMWFQTLPRGLRERCNLRERVPREEALKSMTGARVMLAPSLTDGVPNSMYEAMAAGALPIVSPLETIRPVVENETNVLFARNLYPEEIASALVRAMTDDALVDAAAQKNLELVERIADRREIRLRVIDFYERLTASA